jgi:hypothetical protein
MLIEFWSEDGWNSDLRLLLFNKLISTLQELVGTKNDSNTGEHTAIVTSIKNYLGHIKATSKGTRRKRLQSVFDVVTSAVNFDGTLSQRKVGEIFGINRKTMVVFKSSSSSSSKPTCR